MAWATLMKCFIFSRWQSFLSCLLFVSNPSATTGLCSKQKNPCWKNPSSSRLIPSITWTTATGRRWTGSPRGPWAACGGTLPRWAIPHHQVGQWSSWPDWFKPRIPLGASFDNNNMIFLLREMGAQLKMTTLQVASWDQLINWWALRSNKMQTTKCFAEWNKSWNLSLFKIQAIFD